MRMMYRMFNMGYVAFVVACTFGAHAAVWYELAPDSAGNYDLKISVSPSSLSNWVICSSQSFSVSASDTDRNTTTGSDTANTGFDYFWPSTMVSSGNTVAVRTGSSTASSTTYKAVKCGSTTYAGNALDTDPNGPTDDRTDLEYDIPRYNVEWTPGYLTIVKLGSTFSGHAAATKNSNDTSISVSCTDGNGNPVLGNTKTEFNKDSTSDFDFVPRTKADCRWYPEVTTLRVRAHPKVCASNHTWYYNASSHDEWCKWDCINQNYPTYADIAGNQDTT